LFEQKQEIMTALEFGVIVFTSFFTLINPLGVMPVFMTMTSEMDQRRRTKVAIKAVLVSLFTLVVFILTGQLIFQLFSISVDSLRIVGGVIFFMMGYDMLQARLVRVKMDSPDEIKKYASDIAVTPLAIPMICGPGAITNAIVLWEDANTLQLKAILMVGIVAILLLTLIFLVGSGKIIRFLGETGNKVMMRIMGLIVMVIAVEFFFAGLGPLVARMMGQ
jgi:multiple antibiotic resistance protein